MGCALATKVQPHQRGSNAHQRPSGMPQPGGPGLHFAPPQQPAQPAPPAAHARANDVRQVLQQQQKKAGSDSNLVRRLDTADMSAMMRVSSLTFLRSGPEGGTISVAIDHQPGSLSRVELRRVQSASPVPSSEAERRQLLTSLFPASTGHAEDALSAVVAGASESVSSSGPSESTMMAPVPDACALYLLVINMAPYQAPPGARQGVAHGLTELTLISVDSDHKAHLAGQAARLSHEPHKLAMQQALFGLQDAGPRPAAADDDDEDDDCIICYSNPKSVAVMHCGHVCLCTTCAAMPNCQWATHCPVCRGQASLLVAPKDA